MVYFSTYLLIPSFVPNDVLVNSYSVDITNVHVYSGYW